MNKDFTLDEKKGLAQQLNSSDESDFKLANEIIANSYHSLNRKVRRIKTKEIIWMAETENSRFRFKIDEGRIYRQKMNTAKKRIRII